MCDRAVKQCIQRSCFSPDTPPACNCPELSPETLYALGAVLLFMLLLLLTMAIWHWGRCGERRTTGITDATENLINNPAGSAATSLPPHMCGGRRSRGRTSIDSSLSCVVCFDGAIDCVLMPCAHEVACLRCASRLGLCPICRRPVSSTLRIEIPDAAERARALQQPIAAVDEASEPAAPDAVEAVMEEGAVAASGEDAAAAADATERSRDADGEADDAAPDAAKPGKAVGGLPEQLCLRCAATPPNCVFLPCSHKVWCVDCAAILPPRCPICDCGITQSLKTFHKRL